MGLGDYIAGQFRLIPSYIYGIGLILFIIGCLVTLFMRNRIIAVRMILAMLLFEYMFLIFGTTVLFRQSDVVRHHHYLPFWSYTEKPYGHVLLLPETIVNIVMFVPVGFLVCMIIRQLKWRKVLSIGIGLSLSIEILQLLFKRGFSEFDDVFHNTLGCMIGFVFYKLSALLNRK